MVPNYQEPSTSTLVDRLADDLAQRWRAGERPLVEEYLALYPQLADNPERAAELIYEELCLRQEFGAGGDPDDVLTRFPQWRKQLRALVQCHDFLEPMPAVPNFPSPGENWGDFHLLAELGRGAHGRVFLATQTALADRPVVLKLSSRSGQEHLSLARLQHSHIVPLYSVQDDPTRGLRSLCMPYFGGTTFAHLLELLQSQPLLKRSGRRLLQAIQQAQTTAPLRIPVEGPACQFLAQASYSQAICWLGKCLAEALQYAHERGLVHLDLKPSNVLWAADGQPMLLDLHLAMAPIAAGSPGPIWLGGTPVYMAPEQRLAMAAVENNECVPAAVDGRADLYALGLTLAEGLGGSLPPKGENVASWLRRRNPPMAVGLGDILGKCLAENPEKRYPDAGALANDFRNHLADRPLQGVANRSFVERYQKWQRRRPYQRILVGLAVTVAAAVGLAMAYVTHEAHKADEFLAEGLEYQQKGDYSKAREAWRRGLAMAEGLPFQQDLTEKLRGQLQLAERSSAIQELHLLVERLRALYGADDLSGAAAIAIEGHCRVLWQSRNLIAGQLDTPDLLQREQVRNDLLDLAILWTSLRVRLAGNREMQTVRQEALEVLSQAEALFGGSCILDWERQAHSKALGLPLPTNKAGNTPRSAWENFALGWVHFRDGNLDEAEAEFDHSLALQPQSFWPHFYKGKCAYQKGRFEDAVLAFTACTVLEPEKAWCFFNRGLAYEALGKRDRAQHDYDRATKLDPKLAIRKTSPER